MAKSELIKEITTNKISLEEGLQRLLVISSELENVKLTEWIICELNGYDNDSELPNYRKHIGYRLVYSGINGQFQMTNQTLPLHFFPNEVREEIDETNIKESIRVIEKSIQKKGTVGIDLTCLSPLVYKETGIRCYKIFKEFSEVSLEDVVSKVKNKLIILMLELEKEFGRLDDLDIDIKSMPVEKSQMVKESVHKIFYDGRGEEI